MDLQDIKKEIESLRKETISSTPGSSSDVFIFGLSKIKVGLILLASAISIYLVKPIYIYKFEVSDSGELEQKINYKNLAFVFIITSVLFLSAIKYTKVF
jgi:hypothetical protein